MASNAKILKRIKNEPSDGRPSIKYQIRLLDSSFYDEAVSFMVKHYLHRENLRKALSINLDGRYTEKQRSHWKKYLTEGVSLAAFLEDDNGNKGIMISCNVLNITNKENYSKLFEVTNDCSEMEYKLIKAHAALKGKVESLFSSYDCSSYIDCRGLTVAPGYEGRNIGTEMLMAREEICKLTSIPVCGTIFTNAAVQRAAEKAGYKTLSELDLTTFRGDDGQLAIPNPDWPILKWMAIKYE